MKTKNGIQKLGTFLALGTGLCWASSTAMAQETTVATEATPEVQATPAPLEVAGYEKGFFIQSPDGKFRIVMGGYLQGYADEKILEGAKNTNTFRVRRARLKWAGHMFTKNIQYELEYDFAGSKMLEAMTQLACSDAFKFRVGQYHVPFSFEQAASSSSLQFVDRSIVFAFFGIPDEREPGAGFSGVVGDKKWEYDLGVFNGEGLNTLNQNRGVRVAGRLVYNLAGKHGYEFGDTKQSDDAQVALAFGTMYNVTPDPTTIPAGSTTATANKKVASITTDVSAKYKGLGLHGAFLFQRNSPEAGAAVNDKGLLAQIGYFVVPKTVELGFRTSHLLRDSGNNKGEYTVGMNYYIHNGHQMKFQFDYGLLTEKDGIAAGDNRMDHQIRGQLQLKI